LPPFKIARKSFETYALQLKVRSEIRDKLLGHATIGVKQNYQDWEWDEPQNEIHEAQIIPIPKAPPLKPLCEVIPVPETYSGLSKSRFFNTDFPSS
tara:strand:- start:403 stop:690 length:288 start_codon:yes stop_codon:yes gene_type:complete